MAAKGATKHCCWGECTSDSRYFERLPRNVYFIRFPKPGKCKEDMTAWQKQQEMRKTDKSRRWIHACGRQNFTLSHIKKDTYICSLHFVGGNGPTDINPDPIIATSSRASISNIRKRNASKDRTLIQPHGKRERLGLVFENGDNEGESEDDSSFLNIPPVELEEQTKEQATQTVYDKHILGAKVETMILRNRVTLMEDSKTVTSDNNPMSADIIFENEFKCKYFIGLYPTEFKILYDFLGPAKFELTYWKHRNSVKKADSQEQKEPKCLSIRDQLFVTLLRLRRGFNFVTLSHFYGVSAAYLSNIFLTWIMFLFHHFKDHEDLMFPERHAFRKTKPAIFNKFKNIRAAIDCTEFKCEVPRDYGKQGNMYSAYKHHTTMKCLIAVNPNGAAVFVSDLFEGSADDVHVFKTCGILKHINAGDSFLVDKGFTVQDLLLPLQAKIFIPPFLGKRESFTKEEIILTKQISKARIHVERFNERLKKFRLLDRTIPLVLEPIASQLVFVSCCLVNFQDLLCK